MKLQILCRCRGNEKHFHHPADTERLHAVPGDKGYGYIPPWTKLWCLLTLAYGSSLTAGPHPLAARTSCPRETLLVVSRHANLEMHREKLYLQELSIRSGEKPRQSITDKCSVMSGIWMEVWAGIPPASTVPVGEHHSSTRKSRWNQPWGMLHKDEGVNAACPRTTVIPGP